MTTPPSLPPPAISGLTGITPWRDVTAGSQVWDGHRARTVRLAVQTTDKDWPRQVAVYYEGRAEPDYHWPSEVVLVLGTEEKREAA